MHVPDLSPYPYGKQPSKLSVGWLDDAHEYIHGEVPDGFVERLLAFCRRPVLHTMGEHECELCHNRTGSGEIWVFGSGESIYVAPDLIYHYVVDHHYQPPMEFINAVLGCSLPDSPEYQGRVNQVR